MRTLGEFAEYYGNTDDIVQPEGLVSVAGLCLGHHLKVSGPPAGLGLLKINLPSILPTQLEARFKALGRTAIDLTLW